MGNSEKIRKVVVGFGCWVQGMRCFPCMGVSFFLKDGLNLNPSTLQIILNISNLPMVAKPFYGIISDAVYIRHQHRIPYIALGALLQAISWLAISMLSGSGISIFTVTLLYLLSNFGASIVEVANDAIVAETGQRGELQSFVWMAGSIGGILGNLLGGIAIHRFSPQKMFLFFGTILAVQFFATVNVSESSLNLPKSPPDNGIRKQLWDLSFALRKPEISLSIAWFAASYAVIPVLTGTMFFYQTHHLSIDPSVLGFSKVFGQAAMLTWSIVYNRRLKSIPPRKLISAIQLTIAGFTALDVLFAKGIFREMGMPDSVYVVIFSGLLEVLYFFKILPFSVLIAQLCPPGCEGSLMAFLMSSISLAFIVSGFFGVVLASYVGVTGSDFSGLPRGLLIQVACTLVPLYWSSCIPQVTTPKTRRKKD